jgi:hypothetical protein
MYEEAQKTMFGKFENPKDKQSFRFMHCKLYLKANLERFYGELAIDTSYVLLKLSSIVPFNN